MPRAGQVYNLKHTVAITLANAAAEWEDLKGFFGHTDIKTTRIYTGHVVSRLRKTSEAGGPHWLVADRLPDQSPTPTGWASLLLVLVMG